MFLNLALVWHKPSPPCAQVQGWSRLGRETWGRNSKLRSLNLSRDHLLNLLYSIALVPLGLTSASLSSQWDQETTAGSLTGWRPELDPWGSAVFLPTRSGVRASNPEANVFECGTSLAFNHRGSSMVTKSKGQGEDIGRRAVELPGDIDGLSEGTVRVKRSIFKAVK